MPVNPHISLEQFWKQMRVLHVSGATSVFLDLSPCAWLQITALPLLPGRVRPGHEHFSQSPTAFVERKPGTWNLCFALDKEKDKMLQEQHELQLQSREDIHEGAAESSRHQDLHLGDPFPVLLKSQINPLASDDPFSTA